MGSLFVARVSVAILLLPFLRLASTRGAQTQRREGRFPMPSMRDVDRRLCRVEGACGFCDNDTRRFVTPRSVLNSHSAAVCDTLSEWDISYTAPEPRITSTIAPWHT